MPQPGGLLYAPGSIYPHTRGETLLVVGRQSTGFFADHPSPTDQHLQIDGSSGSRSIAFGKHDGGTPNMNKQFLSITVRGRGIDSDRDWKIEYRVNNATAWTTASASVTSSPTVITLTGVTGYTIQLRVTANAYITSPYPEINTIEVRYLEMPLVEQVHTLILNLDGQKTPSKSQVANLQTALLAAGVSYTDPLGPPAKTAQLRTLTIEEERLVDQKYPVCTAHVTLVETT